MADKWKMHAITTLAIARLEAQSKGSELVEYGTPEHLAVIRYGVLECCREIPGPKVPKLAKDGKPELENGKPVMLDSTVLALDAKKLKDWFKDEAAFLGYASNAKKMLASLDDGKAYPKLAGKEKVTRGYE